MGKKKTYLNAYISQGFVENR